MAISQSQNASHSKIVSPPEMTIPGTQTRHFEIISLKWQREKRMSQELTERVNKLAKETKSVVTVVGMAHDEHGLTVLVEYWRF